MPLDIYRAHHNRFQIIDGKLMPAINSIDGLGDNAAIYIDVYKRQSVERPNTP